MQTVTVPMESLAEVVRLQLENGGRANLTVTGNSMYPLFTSHRDTVTLLQPANLRKGDVVLFQRVSGDYIFHRIIALTETGYICCGDNQAIREPVSREQVIGVMDSFVRNGKLYAVEAGFYRFYAAVWMRLFGLRWLYYVGRRILRRVYRKVRQLVLKKK